MSVTTSLVKALLSGNTDKATVTFERVMAGRAQESITHLTSQIIKTITESPTKDKD